MKFTETRLPGAFIVEIEKLEDSRGFFARTWCRREFEQHGLDTDVMQANMSFNRLKGTLRGMHYQDEPFGETKVVRCSQGAVYDVIIDLRPSSPTYLQHVGVELTAANCRMLFVPRMFAHGFQTLVDDTVVTYQVGQFYTPGAERGIRYDDPLFGIAWPVPVAVISDKDKNWPDFTAAPIAPQPKGQS
jgi:dTDP-4-dehydrorhamnose 3,5-epimerase